MKGKWTYSRHRTNKGKWVATARCTCGMTFNGTALRVKEAKRKRYNKMKNHKCPRNNRTLQMGKRH